MTVYEPDPMLWSDNCGEYYLGTEAARRVLELAEPASAKGIEVEILRYAA